jgi:hypothetical protein
MSTYLSIYLSIYLPIYLSLYMCICMYVCVCAGEVRGRAVSAQACRRSRHSHYIGHGALYIPIYIYVCIYAFYVYVCMHVCMHVCIQLYTHTHTHTHTYFCIQRENRKNQEWKMRFSKIDSAEKARAAFSLYRVFFLPLAKRSQARVILRMARPSRENKK